MRKKRIVSQLFALTMYMKTSLLRFLFGCVCNLCVPLSCLIVMFYLIYIWLQHMVQIQTGRVLNQSITQHNAARLMWLFDLNIKTDWLNGQVSQKSYVSYVKHCWVRLSLGNKGTTLNSGSHEARNRKY